MKRDLAKLYPEFGKKFMEEVEKEMNQQLVYKNASIVLYKMFKEKKPVKLNLV